MTLVEAAEYSGLSANTLRNQIKNSVLKGKRVGNTYVVEQPDLDDYIAKHKGRQGKASPDYPHKRKDDAT